MDEIISEIISRKAKVVAISHDGSEYTYPSKNILESYLLSYGIDVIDCGITVTSAISSCIKDLNADFGVHIYENKGKQEFIVFNNKGFPIVIEKKNITKEIKKWNEIGSIDFVDVNKIYVRKISKILEIDKKIGHLVFNANFSPIAGYISNILISLANRLTTLNASYIQTLNISFEESLNYANKLAKAYNADLVLSIDKHCERLSLINKNGIEEKILNKAITNALNKGPFKKLFLIGDLDLNINDYEIYKVKKIEEVIFNEDIIVADAERSTIIFPMISGWFDSILTFIFCYKDISI